MPERELGAVLKAALIAALAAALVTAAFHFIFTERVIQQAIDLEEEARGPAHEEPVVSRPVQRAGLFLGFVMYGITVGLLFAAVYFAVQGWVPGVGAGRLGLLLALVGCWSVAVFPFLKYPANPPAVGDPGTIFYRQRLYLGVVGLSIAGAVAAFAFDRALARLRERRLGRGRRLLLVLALYGGYAAAIYLLMPSNPDPVPVPMNVLWKFRALSLAGLVLFWLLLGALSALLLGRQVVHPPGRGKSFARPSP